MGPKASTVLALVAAIALSGGIAACGGSSDTTASASSSSGGSNAQLALVAYSTPKHAYDALIAAFAKTSAGKGVSFTESFGPSGTQSRAVASGQPADVVAFSTESDISRLVKAGLVSSNWDANTYKGIVANSVVVFVVRKGNPKHITGWNDLTKPGISVITPNPSTSGSARWNVMAAYGAQLKEGKSPSQALAYVKTLVTKHVSVEDPSGSTAMSTFTGGKGDVLLSYESEAISAVKAGDPVQYIIPKQTILIQTPDAVVQKSSHLKQAQAFVNWLWSSQAQNIWAEKGYRPVVPSVMAKYASKFPTPPQLFTIDSLGGWKQVKKKFFDPSTGLITKIQQEAGFPTASS
ncbi:MAG: sulfate ABC transporter substrate-binding protein [Solirubrobacterales bacterium]|nr:sulfate ABC transporter substrate-binding protein [Solirubrobacterales bacterium]MBV9166655.1 sulfate ABC transporter substrate-binding protein [Solirubrobacterales bacterium]MBV9534427.1 sulfate ABC transporter substrate-binding protein [Solirubrobacterales bacterium]